MVSWIAQTGVRYLLLWHFSFGDSWSLIPGPFSVLEGSSYSMFCPVIMLAAWCYCSRTAPCQASRVDPVSNCIAADCYSLHNSELFVFKHLKLFHKTGALRQKKTWENQVSMCTCPTFESQAAFPGQEWVCFICLYLCYMHLFKMKWGQRKPWKVTPWWASTAQGVLMWVERTGHVVEGTSEKRKREEWWIKNTTWNMTVCIYVKYYICGLMHKETK